MNIRSVMIVFVAVFNLAATNHAFAACCDRSLPTDSEKEPITFNFEQQFVNLLNPDINPLFTSCERDVLFRTYAAYPSTRTNAQAICACKPEMRNALPMLIWGFCKTHGDAAIRSIRQKLSILDSTPVNVIQSRSELLDALQQELELFMSYLNLCFADIIKANQLVQDYNSAPEHQDAQLRVQMEYIEQTSWRVMEQYCDLNRSARTYFPIMTLVRYLYMNGKKISDIIFRIKTLKTQGLSAEQIVTILHANPNTPMPELVAKTELARLMGNL